ncbi:MAG: hypothetical protein FWD40_11965 [Treponema sp.]|nr:hypothetical protein [Treponema sp.]
MTQKTKIHKDRKIIIWFLRLFPECRLKDDTQYLSASIILALKNDTSFLQNKIVRDSNLIESLQRFIKTLETKITYQTELLQEQKERLEALLAAYTHK